MSKTVDIEDLREQMARNGVIQLSAGKNTLSHGDFDKLDALTSADCLPYETVELGDAGEPNLVKVGRIMTDVRTPQLVNRPFSDQIRGILGKSSLARLMRKLLGAELIIRRAQVNLMDQVGSFVGKHLDTDSNPSYIVAVVLQFDEQYEGGDYRVYGEQPTEIHLPYRGIVLSRCDIPHEVTPLVSGSRKSLVYFVTSSLGLNPRYVRQNVCGVAEYA